MTANSLPQSPVPKIAHGTLYNRAATIPAAPIKAPMATFPVGCAPLPDALPEAPVPLALAPDAPDAPGVLLELVVLTNEVELLATTMV